MSSTNRSRKSRTYTPNMRIPSKEKEAHRVPLALLLLFFLPPIGLYYLWRMGVFRIRGRFFMTILSMVEMVCLLMLILPAQSTPTQMPVPSVPIAATVVPNGEIVNALSNIDQLLADQQAQSAAENAELTPAPTDRAAYEAEQEAILDTIVYSVWSNAKYYHAIEICGTQSNRRQLTVREALQENMGACPNCNPPVYLG